MRNYFLIICCFSLFIINSIFAIAKDLPEDEVKRNLLQATNFTAYSNFRAKDIKINNKKLGVIYERIVNEDKKIVERISNDLGSVYGIRIFLKKDGSDFFGQKMIKKL